MNQPVVPFHPTLPNTGTIQPPSPPATLRLRCIRLLRVLRLTRFFDDLRSGGWGALARVLIWTECVDSSISLDQIPKLALSFLGPRCFEFEDQRTTVGFTFGAILDMTMVHVCEAFPMF